MKCVFIRSAEHDITNAIPRAIEAARGSFTDIDVLCWNRTSSKLPAFELRDGVTIHRFIWPTSVKSVRGLIALGCFQLWVAYHLLRLRPKAVQTLDFECVWPTVCVGFLVRAYRIYDMRDPFAYSHNFPPLVRRILYTLDWMAMGLCNAFIIPSAERHGYLGVWGRSKRPVVVVLNTCPDESAELPETFLLHTNAIKIAYLGFLSATRAGELLVDFVDSQDGTVHLFIAGSVRPGLLSEKIQRSRFSKLLGQVPRLEALAVMRHSHAVSLLYDPDIPVNRMAAPNKFYEALCVGTPVIVARGMSIAEEVESHGLGWVVEYGNEHDLLDLTSDAADAKLMTAMRCRCREHYLAHCDYQKQFAIYKTFYENTQFALAKGLT